ARASNLRRHQVHARPDAARARRRHDGEGHRHHRWRLAAARARRPAGDGDGDARPAGEESAVHGRARLGAVPRGVRSAQGSSARIATPLSERRAGARPDRRRAGDWIDGVTSAASLKNENARLRRRLDAARGQEAAARAATQENKDLKKLLDLPFVDNADAIAAQVVEGAPSNFEYTVQIGKGESDGVGVDMPVVTGAGLVGRVLEVSRDRATVLLVKDPQSGVGVRIEKSGTPGVVKGRGDS